MQIDATRPELVAWSVWAPIGSGCIVMTVETVGIWRGRDAVTRRLVFLFQERFKQT